jgi:predicted sulfurtransferase
MHGLYCILLTGMLSLALAQDGQKYPVDPQTGQAVGAKEISPEELKKYIDKKTKSLIIDVRDPDDFAVERIKGAINIPISRLNAYLMKIPKDTALFFT